MLRKELHSSRQTEAMDASWKPGDPYKIRNYPAGLGVSLIAGSVRDYWASVVDR